MSCSCVKPFPGIPLTKDVLHFAYENGYVLLTCNRDDFLHLAAARPHHGIVIIIRRRTRADERAALFRLLNALVRLVSEITSTSHNQGCCIRRIRDAYGVCQDTR
jgi:tRNA G18 (ribose-2'-O)-methylase SpoU